MGECVLHRIIGTGIRNARRDPQPFEVFCAGRVAGGFPIGAKSATPAFSKRWSL